jgi:exosortase/archaeosortase family protein
VIIGNGLRVAIVVYGVTHWTEQLGTGLAHEALGLVVFFFIVLMALSTDRFLQAILLGTLAQSS